MKKTILVLMVLTIITTTAHAKKVEDLTIECFAVTVQDLIADAPQNVGYLAYKTIIIAGKVITYPFKQLEKIAE